jgi:glutamyl-tRNA synthetase
MNTDHKSTPVTRIPPSPTGNLHIGTARTALFNYLYAKQHGGEFLYRSEDTDTTRSTVEYAQEIEDGLQWLGLHWDNKEIFRQSERHHIYRTHIEHMLEHDTAYISEEPSKQDPSTTVAVVRLRNPNVTITFTDLIRGEISFDTTELGDFVIARSVDDALYHLTVVVDDAAMGVTHILRGEDHISNTPRQILILEALGFNRPTYAHLPLILAPDRSKMSKRHGAVAIREYQQMGFLPESMVNYLALLGWNPGTDQEYFTLDTLCHAFAIDKIQKGGAVFDQDKLRSIQRMHIQSYAAEEMREYVDTAILEYDPSLTDTIRARFACLAPTILERHPTRYAIGDAMRAGEYDFLLTTPQPTLELIQWKNDISPADALPRLNTVLGAFPQIDFGTPEKIKEIIWPITEEFGRGEVLWPLRTALTGQQYSPDPFSVLHALGKEESERRITHVCDKIHA